jgi:hypothetical protein
VSAGGRGNTHRGRPATLPDGLYEPSIDPATAERSGPAGLIVNFRGEDGREHAFDVSALPLPGWHEALAEAWAKRVGPEGSLRTLASALGTWYVLTRFMRFMAQRLKPPATPAELTRADIEAFYNRDNGPRWSGVDEMRRVTLLFAVSPLRGLISADVNDYVRKPTLNGTDHGKPGYSDAEYRRILHAARADTALIRDRIRRGRRLVQLWRNDRDGLTAEDGRLAEQLAAIAESGYIPERPDGAEAGIASFRFQLARNLYVTPLREVDKWSMDPRFRPSENTTARIPEQVLGPLVTWSLRFVDDFAPDILAAHRIWANARNPNRPKADRYAEPTALHELLDTHLRHGRPLPGRNGSVNLKFLSDVTGVTYERVRARGDLIGRVTAIVGISERSCFDIAIQGQLDGQPWIDAISSDYRDQDGLAVLARMLQIACYTIIAYLSRMRDSEKRAYTPPLGADCRLRHLDGRQAGMVEIASAAVCLAGSVMKCER